MADPILFPFVATGQSGVEDAFRGIEKAAKDNKAAQESLYRQSVVTAREMARGPDGARRSLSELEKLGQRVAAAQERDAKRGAAAQERAAKAAAKAVEKSAKDQEKANDRAAKAAEKAAERAARAKSRAADKEWKDAERYAARAKRELDKGDREAERSAKRRAAVQQRQSDKNSKSIQSLAMSGGRFALGLAAAGGALAAGVVGSATREVMTNQDTANRISIRGRSPGQASVDPTMLRKEMESTAIAHAGQTSENVAGGISAYQEHRGGDAAKALEEARQFSDVFATFASSTGKEASEFGELGATLAKKFDIKGPEAMGDAIAQVTARAKAAGVPLEQAISHFDKLASSAQRFGLGKGTAGVNQLGALTSIASQGVGAQGADMAVNMLLTKLTSEKTARKLKGGGIDVFKTDKSGDTNPIGEVLRDIITKTGPADNMAEKRAQVQTAIGGPKAFAAIEPLFQAYADAFGKTTGTVAERTKAAGEAMTAAFDAAGAASGSYAEAKVDAQQAESSSSAQLEAAWQKVVAAVGDEFAPQLIAFAAQMANSKPAFDLLVGALSWLGSALNAFADWLQKKGLISGGTHQEKADAAAARGDALEAQLKQMGPYEKLDAAGQRRYNSVNSRLLKARDEQETEGSAAAYNTTAAAYEKKINDEWVRAHYAADSPEVKALNQNMPPAAGAPRTDGGNAPGVAPPAYMTDGQGTAGKKPGFSMEADAAAASAKAAAAHVQAAKDLSAAARTLGRASGSIFGKPVLTGGTN